MLNQLSLTVRLTEAESGMAAASRGREKRGAGSVSHTTRRISKRSAGDAVPVVNGPCQALNTVELGAPGWLGWWSTRLVFSGREFKSQVGCGAYLKKKKSA